MNIKRILQAVATENNVSVEKAKSEMEKAILSAKDTPYFKEVFGERIPSLEEFIAVSAWLAGSSVCH